MNSENSKRSKSHRFKLDLTEKRNLKDTKKNMASANLSIYYTWKNIRSEYNNNNFKISAPAWNDTFDLPDGSYSFCEHSRLLWIYHQITRNFDWKSSCSNLPK